MAIRAYRPGDDEAMYEICRLTGPTNGDGELVFQHPRLLGEVYVGPYLALEPGFAFVALDGGGVAGYVIGAFDTEAFEAACEKEWWPRRREDYPESAFPLSDGNYVAESRLVRKIHHPELTPGWLMRRYPSHLHIDLLPRLQGRGCGRKLMMRLLAALREAGSAGVHLGVGAGNQSAIGFYEHIGFTTVSGDESALTMALPLSDADDAG